MSDDEKKPDLVDTRTRAEKLGELPQQRTKLVSLPTFKNPKVDAAMKAKRLKARTLALDYTEMAILAAVQVMQESQSETAKISAIRILMEYGLGKPTTVHTDADGAPLLPNLVIISGVGSDQVQTITSNLITDQDEDEEDDV